MNMSVRLIKSAEQDDAAFRARLAPLASEVLPPSRAVPPPAIASSFLRRNVIVVGALAACVIAGAAWWFSGRLHVFGRVADSAAPTAPSPAASDVAPAAAAAMAHATTATAPSHADAEIVGLLRRRGDAALAEGDIVTARLLFEQAADMGSPAAATAAGKTYDAEFLAQYGARGIRPDQVRAAAWFRKAVALGDVDAQGWLARIEGRPRP
jgi:TPR repeat protein